MQMRDLVERSGDVFLCERCFVVLGRDEVRGQ